MTSRVHIDPEERRLCTILFADLVHSTLLIGGLDAEDALSRLSPAVGEIMSTSEKFGATTTFTGDGAMAVFGYPIADEDHVLRAVTCAEEIVRRIAQMGDEHIQVRVGIHTGEVLVGHLHHANADERTFLGPTMHIARKIEEASRSNVVTVSEQVIDAIGDMFVHSEIGRIVLDGAFPSVRLFEVRGRDETVSRAASRPGMELSPFVGRGEEIRSLNEAWAEASGGHGNALLVFGAAGVGKSRLLQEFIAQADPGPGEILEINCSSLDQDAAYLPITRMLRTRMRITEDTVRDEIEQRIIGLIGRYTWKDEATQAALVSLFDHRETPVEPSSIDLGRRKRLLVDLLLHMIEAVGGDGPLVVIFEDVHWIDAGSMSVVQRLAENIADRPILLVLTSRTSDLVDAGGFERLTPVPVDPLDATSCGTLISQLVGEEAANKPLRDVIESLSDRTPLFVEELCHHLRQLAAGAGGTQALLDRIAAVQIPARVQPLIAGRIDALSTDQRKAVRLLAAGGLEWPADLASQALEHIGLDAGSLLDGLIEGGLLKLEYVNNVSQLRFRHALVQKEAYRGIPRLRRKALHAAVLETLSAASRSDDLGSAQALARHADGAEMWLEAAKAYNRCGFISLNLTSFDNAERYFDNTIRCLEKMTDGAAEEEIVRLRLEARRGLRVALGASGDCERMLEIAREVEELCTRIRNAAGRVAAQVDQAMVLTINAGARDAVRVARHALDSADSLGDPGLLANAAFALAQAAWFRGDFRCAASVIDAHSGRFTADFRHGNSGTTGSVSVLGLATRANALSIMGRVEDADAGIAEVLGIANETGKAYDRSFALTGLGIGCWMQGHHDDGIVALRQALAAAEEAGIDVLRCFAAAPLARLLGETGQFEEARQELTAALAFAERMKMPTFEAWLLSAEASLLWREHRPLDAGNLTRDLLKLCRRNGYGAIRALLLADTIAMADSPSDLSPGQVAAAIRACRVCGMDTLANRLETLTSRIPC